jgi:hypothetical protein
MALGERLEDAPTRVGTSETDDSEFPIRCGSTAGGAVRWWRNGRRERPSRARGGDRVGGQDGGWPGTRGGWKVGRSWGLFGRAPAPQKRLRLWLLWWSGFSVEVESF